MSIQCDEDKTSIQIRLINFLSITIQLTIQQVHFMTNEKQNSQWDSDA